MWGGALDSDDASTCTYGKNGAQRHPPSKNLLKTRDHSTPDDYGPFIGFSFGAPPIENVAINDPHKILDP